LKESGVLQGKGRALAEEGGATAPFLAEGTWLRGESIRPIFLRGKGLAPLEDGCPYQGRENPFCWRKGSRQVFLSGRREDCSSALVKKKIHSRKMDERELPKEIRARCPGEASLRL